MKNKNIFPSASNDEIAVHILSANKIDLEKTMVNLNFIPKKKKQNKENKSFNKTRETFFDSFRHSTHFAPLHNLI